MSVVIKDDRLLFDALRKELKKANKEVVAGIQAGPEKDGLQVAQYATWNEFGIGNIPARPFMRGYFDKNIDTLTRFCRNGVTQVALGNATFEQFMNVVGSKLVSGIKHSIAHGEWVENSKSTIRRKGAGKPPLIDTSTMLKSVTFAIRKYGETKN